MNLGFIGHGVTGVPMALHLRNAGHDPFGHTRGALGADVAASSANACASGLSMGENITLVGGNGDGQTCNFANQIIS